MTDKRSGSGGLFAVGMVLGAAAGVVTGLLLAPRSGRETRRILKKSADALPELAGDLSTTAQLKAEQLSGTALRNWDGTLGRLKEAIAAGIEASQHESAATISSEPLTPPESQAKSADTH
ncbi:MAG: YtxH domain-containing protein [Kaiparowitsia implicata GSE-PSE-MK54-09C]|jgi:gas vesicle protein|nr:YtxH domain-containing protein [Kaiparowitsia implicata GSE-PSE-MK54-09C]